MLKDFIARLGGLRVDSRFITLVMCGLLVFRSATTDDITPLYVAFIVLVISNGVDNIVDAIKGLRS